MKQTFKPLILISITLALLSACGGPTKAEIEEIKDEEYRYMASCIASHTLDKNFNQCETDFKAKFGYEYQDSYVLKEMKFEE